MNAIKSATNFIRKGRNLFLLILVSGSAFAQDRLSGAMQPVIEQKQHQEISRQLELE